MLYVEPANSNGSESANVRVRASGSYPNPSAVFVGIDKVVNCCPSTDSRAYRDSR